MLNVLNVAAAIAIGVCLSLQPPINAAMARIVGSSLLASCISIAISLLGEALKPFEETLELYGLSQVLIALGLIVALRLRPQGLFGSGEPGLLLGTVRRAPQPA